MKKVVIIGGGFAGSYVAKFLEDKFNVTLIDSKNFFEFTPSVLRTIIEPEHIKKIQVLHLHHLKKSKFIYGQVTSVSKKFVFVGRKKIPFDYLVIASGSRYESLIKEQNTVLPTRADNLKKCHIELENAKKVLIIGGGLVGIELASEIASTYKNKKITIVHDKDKILKRNSGKTAEYAIEFLNKLNVKFIFNEKVVKGTKKNFITDKGTKIKADMAFFCTGIKSNSEFLKKNFQINLTERGQVIVDKYLRVKGYKNIFAIGDISSVKEEKLAQNAEKEAEIAVKNIICTEKESELCEYSPKKRIMVISLGKYNGIIEYKNFVFTGILPAFLKSFIEWKTMRRYK